MSGLQDTVKSFAEIKAIMSETGRGEEREEFPSVLQSEENNRRQELNREVPENVVRAKEHLMQSANLLNLVIACVDKAVAPKVPAIVQTTEFFTACVQMLFRESQFLVAHMPDKPMR